MSFSLADYLYTCVLYVNTGVYVRVYIHIVLNIVRVQVTLHTSTLQSKLSGRIFVSSVIPRVSSRQPQLP